MAVMILSFAETTLAIGYNYSLIVNLYLYPLRADGKNRVERMSDLDQN
ncbi:hypothetical protein Cylst_5938 [Cylindrospermum stagnale PCC 7417]|uniref:Uncharacterized protein n=1 Tax=Cylindrospermum stagnale PCC 7417 TaxID=56107 RepID=K9X5Y5_9NOST|nr:hypothetical protein Cylst_5938 [Cylindrospermum stagnale PCC 7417]